jgi:SOS-response transcriptional repressor LexA
VENRKYYFMQSNLDMEKIRQRISAALDASSGKSRSKLAKLLGISPTQVTSLLKPGGRRLQAAEVPIVERYLGISLLETDETFAEELSAPSILFDEGNRFPFNEGEPVDLAALPADLARYLKSVMARRQAEVWRLSTDLIEAAGYLPGDYVVVDLGQIPRPRDVVLAELRESHGQVTPIFRAYVPPYLMVLSLPATLETPLIVDDGRVIIKGVIVSSVRASSRQVPRRSR